MSPLSQQPLVILVMGRLTRDRDGAIVLDDRGEEAIGDWLRTLTGQALRDAIEELRHLGRFLVVVEGASVAAAQLYAITRARAVS